MVNETLGFWGVTTNLGFIYDENKVIMNDFRFENLI